MSFPGSQILVCLWRLLNFRTKKRCSVNFWKTVELSACDVKCEAHSIRKKLCNRLPKIANRYISHCIEQMPQHISHAQPFMAYGLPIVDCQDRSCKHQAASSKIQDPTKIDEQFNGQANLAAGPAFSSNCPSDKMPQPASVTDTQTVGQGKRSKKIRWNKMKIMPDDEDRDWRMVAAHPADAADLANETKYTMCRQGKK